MPALEVAHVSLRVSSSFALKDISFSCPSGTVLGVVGPNGSGKTTLLNTMSGLSQLDSGEVWFQGRRSSGVPFHCLTRNGLGRTFQKPRLPRELKVSQLFRLALRADPRSQVGRATARQNHDAVLAAMGLDVSALWDSEVRSLSFGEMKLVTIAVCLARQPRVALLDEPFAGLHDSVVVMVAEWLRVWCRTSEAALVIVEHNIQALSSTADAVLVLEDGEVRAHGSVDEVLKDPLSARAFFG